MTPEQSNEIIKKLGAILLLSKPETRSANLLGALGLYPMDFPESPFGLAVSYDHNGILVVCSVFKGICTCAESPKDPQVHRVPDDPNLHASSCDVWKAYSLSQHPCLLDVEFDKSGKAMSFNFAWPREFNPHQRIVLQTKFPELKSDTLWGNFLKTWGNITKLMDPMPITFKQKSETAETQNVPEITFDDLDLGAVDPVAEDKKGEAPNPKPIEEVAKEIKAKRGRKKKEEKPEREGEGAIPQPETQPEEPAPQVPAMDFGSDLDLEPPTAPPSEAEGEPDEQPAPPEPAAPVEQPEPQPTPEEPAPKAERKKRQKKEAEEEGPDKRDPMLVKFSNTCGEECLGIKGTAETIAESESFPADSLEMLKRRIDRLAQETARLLFKGRNKGAEREINAVVGITLANLTTDTRAAVRDLELSPDKPTSWIAFAKDLKKVIEKAESLADIISQSGMADVVCSQPKLKDRDGNPLVP